MNLERFETQRGPDWVRLDTLLDRASGRRGARRLGAGGVLELGALYRGAAADLAYARRRFPDDPVVGRLRRSSRAGAPPSTGARAAGAARSGSSPAATGAGSPSGRGSWRWRGRCCWCPPRPARRGASPTRAPPWLVPEAFAGAADPPAAGRDFGAGEGSVFATQVLLNNIQVTLVAFAGGLLFGVGTALALVYNGLLLGVVGGLAFGAGNGEAFVRLISSHGPLELSCIVVGGVAGLRLGHALIVPGPRTRTRSLQQEARRSVELAVGTAPWLVLCGFLEGLATGPELPVAVQVGIGLGLAALFWGLVVWRGTGVDRLRAS